MGKLLHETKEHYIEHLLSCIETSQELLETLESVAKKFPKLTQEVGEAMESERAYLKELQGELDVALVS